MSPHKNQYFYIIFIYSRGITNVGFKTFMQSDWEHNHMPLQLVEAVPRIFNRGAIFFLEKKSGNTWVPTHSQVLCFCKK